MCMLCQTLDKTDLLMWLGVMKGKDWVAETKEDGDRVRMLVENKKVSLFNRHGKDVTLVYPEFKGEVDLPDCFLDGEMCVLDDKGISQFNTGISFRTHCKDANTIRSASEAHPVTYVVFDMLKRDNKDLRGFPLSARRKWLEELNLGKLKYFKLIEQSKDIVGLWNMITSAGGEGIILKDNNAPYFEGKRSPRWLKVKNIKEVDLVFTKFEEHAKGITIESDGGIRVTCNGAQSEEVKRALVKNSFVKVTIRHLGETEAHKFRQPTFMKMVS